MATLPIPTSEQLTTATEQGFPHYSLQLPEWPAKPPPAPPLPPPKLEDNVSKKPTYDPDHHPLNCVNLLAPRIDTLKAKFTSQLHKITATRVVETSPGSDKADTLTLVPHNESDVRHVDPGKGGGNFRSDFKTVKDTITKLNKDARSDGELAAIFSQTLKSLGQVEELLGTGASGAVPKGMQRLRLIFQWVLCQVITLFGEINAALDRNQAAQNDQDKHDAQRQYEEARKGYIELLQDLDDREPHTKPKPPIPGVSGYGRVIKWMYILPLIHGGRIKGAKVIGKWNPHISSSGIPIPHA